MQKFEEKRFRSYQKYAWVPLMGLGVLGVFFGAFIALTVAPPEPETFAKVTGSTWAEIQDSQPGIAQYIEITLRSEGLFIFAVGALIIPLAGIPYRRGEKWAWSSAWFLPAFYSVLAFHVFSAGGMGWPIIVAQLVLVLLVQLLSYSRFYPGKSVSTQDARTTDIS